MKREAEQEPPSVYDKVKSWTNKREAEEDCVTEKGKRGEEARKISKQILLRSSLRELVLKPVFGASWKFNIQMRI